MKETLFVSAQVPFGFFFDERKEVDRLASEGQLPEPASVDFVRWLHQEFYRDAPIPMLQIGSGNREFRMTPGQWRTRPEHDVAVGRHLPPSSARVDELIK